jgi:hypothetical protein
MLEDIFQRNPEDLNDVIKYIPMQQVASQLDEEDWFNFV